PPRCARARCPRGGLGKMGGAGTKGTPWDPGARGAPRHDPPGDTADEEGRAAPPVGLVCRRSAGPPRRLLAHLRLSLCRLDHPLGARSLLRSYPRTAPPPAPPPHAPPRTPPPRHHSPLYTPPL